MSCDLPRAFLALWPDHPARAALAALPLPTGGTPVHPLDLHLTLAFLGPVSCADPLQFLRSALPAPCGPVRVTLTAQEVWAGPAIACAAGDCPAVQQLAAALAPGLLQLGYPAERRPLRPHVTLCRRLRRPDAARVELAHPLSWLACTLSLVASGPAADGRRYHEVARLPFA